MTEQEEKAIQNSKNLPHSMKRYYRVDEVAEYFAISVRTVYRLLDEGDLQATRIRGCLLVSAEEIKSFEDELMKLNIVKYY